MIEYLTEEVHTVALKKKNDFDYEEDSLEYPKVGMRFPSRALIRKLEKIVQLFVSRKTSTYTFMTGMQLLDTSCENQTALHFLAVLVHEASTDTTVIGNIVVVWPFAGEKLSNETVMGKLGQKFRNN